MNAGTTGMAMGALVVGGVCGLLPFLVGLRKNRPQLALGALVTCVIGGIMAGIILALPLAVAFMLVIMLTKPSRAPARKPETGSPPIVSLCLLLAGVGIAVVMVVGHWLTPYWQARNFSGRLDPFGSLNMEKPPSPGGTSQPYRRGKVLAVIPERAHPGRSGSDSTATLPPQIHPAWYKLDQALRATRPEEVGTLIRIHANKRDSGMYQQQGGVRTKYVAVYVLRLKIYDWKSQVYVGDVVMDPGAIKEGSLTEDELDAMADATSPSAVAARIAALPVAPGDSEGQKTPPPQAMSSAADEVRGRVQQLVKAINAHDDSAVEQFLGDGFVYVSPKGTVLSPGKNDFLKVFRKTDNNDIAGIQVSQIADSEFTAVLELKMKATDQNWLCEWRLSGKRVGGTWRLARAEVSKIEPIPGAAPSQPSASP